MKRDLVPAPDDDSALASLLRGAIPYERAGAVVPRELLQFGLYGSAIVIITGLLALTLPGADAIRHSGFYLVLGSVLANLDSLMGALAGPAIIFGGALLIVDAYLMQVRTSAKWRSVVVIQAGVGGAGGIMATLFLALIILNLAIWIAIIALGLGAIMLIIGAMAGG
jgi:hypothetical protein